MPSVVTSRLQGLEASVAVKAPVRVATTVSITLSGLQTVDGVALSARDRVLVKDQSNAVDNGIWVAGSGAWTRALDFDGTRDAVGGTRVFVTEGGVAGSSEWKVYGNGPIDIGTDSITFVRITPGGNVPDGAITPLAYGAVGDGVTDDQAACNAAATAARAAGKVLYFPAGYHFYVSEKIDRTGVHVHGDGEASVITGAAGKDILYWKRPDEAGWVRPFRHITQGLKLFLDDTSDVSASYNRIGVGGERVGNGAVVFPADNSFSSATWEHPIFRNLNIYCSTGTNKGNRTAAFFFGHPFNGMYLEDCYAHFPSYGLIQGVSGARPVSLDGSANTVTWAGHGLSNNQTVTLIFDSDEAALPSELLAPVGNIYHRFARQLFYVRNATTDTFQLSYTSGGSAIDFTGSGVGQIYAAKAGANAGVEFAPDEWKMRGVTLNARRVGLTLANNNFLDIDQLVIHPLRAAFKFLNFPSTIRTQGGAMESKQFYTEGPLDADFTAEYIRSEWNNASMTDYGVTPASGACNVVLAGSDCDYGTVTYTTGAAIYISGHRNDINGYPVGAPDSRIVDRGSDNKVHYQRESGGSSNQGTPDRMSNRSLNFRDGFDPTTISRNPSSGWRGSNTLFVSGPWTIPFGLSIGSQFDFYYDDDTTQLPEYLRVFSSVATAINYSTWAGNVTGTTFTVGTNIPASWGTLHMRARASTATTANLTVNLATVPTPTPMSLTTIWQPFSVRYNATAVAPGTGLSATIGTRSVAADIDVDWFYFEPDCETVRGHALALSNSTTTTSAPSAGGAGALPATPAGYITVNINGTNRQLAYY